MLSKQILAMDINDASITHATLVSVMQPEKIKEEDMPKVEVHNNDRAAQEYLKKLNF